MCFLRIRPEHAPMNPPGAAPTLTNIYDEDKYFPPPSSPTPNASPSNPNPVSPNPTQPRGSSTPRVQQQHRHQYPRYHHHETRKAVDEHLTTTTTPPAPPKTKRKKETPIPAVPPTKKNKNEGARGDPLTSRLDPTAIHGTPTTTTDHGAHKGPSGVEQLTRTKIGESLDVGAGGGTPLFTGLTREDDGFGLSSSLGGVGEDEGEKRVEGMRREVEGLEREVRGIGRAL